MQNIVVLEKIQKTMVSSFRFRVGGVNLLENLTFFVLYVSELVFIGNPEGCYRVVKGPICLYEYL